MTSAEIEAYVRISAAHGFSRTAVALTLGIRHTRFVRILSALPDVQWPAPRRSVDERRHYDSLKGRCVVNSAKGSARGGAATQALYSHTVRDCHGTISQLIERFGLSVTDSTVRKRMAKGADLETALFTPVGQFRPPQRTSQE